VLRSRYRKNGWPYDMLIIDESSMFKSAKAKRFTSLRYQLKHFERRVILTGTPAPKGLLDLWGQIFILDEGLRLGENVGRYRTRFFSPSGYMGYGYKPDAGAEKVITELIAPLILTMRAEDWLELPKVLEQTVYVDLPPKARALYTRMEQEMFLELDNGSTEAVSAASLSAKCWQMANGALILEDELGEKTWQAIHDAKLEALQEVIDGVGGNVLVAYWFKHDLARLKSMFPKAPVFTEAKNERAFNRMQAEWNAGEHRVGLIHPQGGGHGINLQGGGNVLVFFSMLWGREAFAQVKERMGASRQVGLRDHVMYKYIVARDTVDELMLMTQRSRYEDERRYIKLLRDYRDIQDILA
jgi:SNF2 family DNA or RNA helicase